MTPKVLIAGLCIAAMVAVAISLALVLYTNYLVNRCGKLEMQNENKTELICILNNRLDEAHRDYNELEADYKKLMYERAKENDRR